MAPPALPSSVHISSHPCVISKLSILRSQSTTNARDVKALLHEIATMVACEAFAHSLKTVPTGTDKSPLDYTFPTLSIAPSKMNVVPILRSGLSMVDAVTSLLPFPVPVNHLGLFREKYTLQPVEYYNNLPDHRPAPGAAEGEGPVDLAIVVDPIIATGATATAAVETLREWGVKRILVLCILCSHSGVTKVASECGPDVEIWAGGCDEDVDGKGMIKPGVGDIGDRLFMTVGK